MPVSQQRNADAQLLGYPDHLSTDDRNYSAEWLDTVGNQNTIVAVTVNFDHERHNFAPEIFDMDNDILTILEAGFYQISYCLAAQKVGTSEGSFYAYLEEDPDTGVYAIVPATQSATTVFSAPGNVVNMANLHVGANYKYRLRFATFGVGFTTIASQSKLSVVRLFKNG